MVLSIVTCLMFKYPFFDQKKNAKSSKLRTKCFIFKCALFSKIWAKNLDEFIGIESQKMGNSFFNLEFDEILVQL